MKNLPYTKGYAVLDSFSALNMMPTVVVEQYVCLCSHYNTGHSLTVDPWKFFPWGLHSLHLNLHSLLPRHRFLSKNTLTVMSGDVFVCPYGSDDTLNYRCWGNAPWCWLLLRWSSNQTYPQFINARASAFLVVFYLFGFRVNLLDTHFLCQVFTCVPASPLIQ